MFNENAISPIEGGELTPNLCRDVLEEKGILARRVDVTATELGVQLSVDSSPSKRLAEAIEVLGQRKNTRLLKNPNLAKPLLSKRSWVYRFVRGGVMRQPPHSYVLNLKKAKWVGGKPSSYNEDSLIIAWVCSFTSNHGGNEVALVKNGQLLGVGGGPSTIEAVDTAINRSTKYHKDLLKGSIFAADAFFPFTDAPELLALAGCVAGVVPSGGIRENEVMSFFSGENISIILLDNEIRGFCRH